MSNVRPIPEGYRTITPYIIVDGAKEAIELYKQAFGAELLTINHMGEKVINASIKIGDSILMLNDEFPDYGAVGPKKIGDTAVTIHLYVEDVSSAWQKALDAGMEVSMPLADQPWGDRYGSLKDRFGHSWSMATHIEEVSDEEFAKRMTEM